MSNGHFVAMIQAEMKAMGISKARLARHCRASGISENRVREALDGNPGWMRKWNQVALQDWIRLVRGAWLA